MEVNMITTHKILKELINIERQIIVLKAMLFLCSNSKITDSD